MVFLYINPTIQTWMCLVSFINIHSSTSNDNLKYTQREVQKERIRSRAIGIQLIYTYSSFKHLVKFYIQNNSCYCRAVIDLICLILSVIDCVMTSRLIHTSQTTIFRHRTVFIFSRMLM